MVEQYLAEDIAAGRVVTLAQKQAAAAEAANAAAALVSAAGVPISIPNIPPTGVPPSGVVPTINPENSLNSLPSFEATAMELKNPSSGLDLSLHGLVDPDTGAKINLQEFLDESETITNVATTSNVTTSERIMQVDGMLTTSSSNVIMQVDGNIENEATGISNKVRKLNNDFQPTEIKVEIKSEPLDESSANHQFAFESMIYNPNFIMQVDGADDDLDEMVEDEAEAEFSEFESRSNTPTSGGISRCPLCDIPTKNHKTYHLAIKHFKSRLVATLPKSKPFICPECNEYEAKTRINLWTHYLGKHKFSKKWTEEMLAQKQNGAVVGQSELASSSVQAGPHLNQFQSPPFQHHVQAHANNFPSNQSLPHQAQIQQSQDSHHQVSQTLPQHHQSHQASLETSPLVPLQATMQAAIHASMQAPIQKPVLQSSQSVRPPMIGQGGPTSSMTSSTPQLPPPPYQQPLGPQMPPASNGRLQSLLQAQGGGLVSKEGVPPPPYPGQVLGHDLKFEVKREQPSEEQGTKIEAKTEVKVEPQEPSQNGTPSTPVKSSTPTTTQIKSSPASTPKTGRERTPNMNKSTSIEFWCDLCQKLISFVARWSHFATVHFDSRLRSELPTSEPFMCSYCNHVGKDFTKLTNHFLNRHDVLEDWIRDELDILEDEIIAKSNNNVLVVPPEAEADFIEIDDDFKASTENAPLNGQYQNNTTNPDLRTLISKLYPDIEQPPAAKRRKISKAVQDRGLEAIKDIIEPKSPAQEKYNRVLQSIPASRDPIPVRVLTSTVASKMLPQAPPHLWLCNGRLLMLTDPSHPNNVELFQGKLKILISRNIFQVKRIFVFK